VVIRLDAGESAGHIAQGFTTSPEFQIDEVLADYGKYLGRLPAAAELAGWVAALQAGVPETQVQASFLASTEYFSRHGGAVAPWLNGIYQDALGRNIDAAGLASWTAELQTGTPRQTVALAIATSTEGDGVLVRAAYSDLLGRPPDQGGLTGWVNALQGGMPPATLRAMLASSEEYIQQRAGGLDAPSPAPVSDPPPSYSPDPDPIGVPVIPDPVIIDPGATNPGTADPGVTDPGIPDPGATDPGATDPAASDPGYDGGSDPGTGGDDCGC
jgi:hypothetical protein